jgi:uncharacterized repeat protein (TIGR01451 family)
MVAAKKERHLFSLFIRLSILCTLILAVNLRSVTGASGDPDFYYYSGGRKNTLPLSKEMLAVRFKHEVSPQQTEAIVQAGAHLVLFSQLKELSAFKLSLLPLSDGITEENVIQTINSLNTRPEIEFANPVFAFSDAELIFTDEFIVKFRPSASEVEIEAFNTLHNVEIVRKPQWTERYTLRVKDPKGTNVLTMANLYYENPITEFAMPNFVRKLKPMSITPDDAYFTNQWALNNTGQDPPGGTPDADIDAPEGWDISTGSSDIVIAIIDEGVDTTHEDLVSNLVDGYDFVEYDNDPTPWGDDAHGTACAGLAAAETDNEKGISGVSWNCRIMPIRVAYGVGDHWFTTDDQLASGIEWASDNGADVLSNSWGGGPDSDTIHNAIIDAKNNGRGGKGCVLVFASGNNNGPVSYPAKYPEVIAVGATDEDDIRWSVLIDWGSNYGNELDVVAPSAWGSGEGVIFWTMDITGSRGYNPGSTSEGDAAGNYTKWFGGTSAATPQVAGLAGLILSMNPDLTSDEVQSIVESTADDLGDTGWDQYYGWGRINLYYAVIEAGTQAGKQTVIMNKADDVNGPVSPGDYITYTISLENTVRGPNDANFPFGDLTNVTIVDHLPDEVYYNNPFDPNYDIEEHTYTWNIGTLAEDDSNSVELTVIVNNLAEPLGKITNVCVVEANEIWPKSMVELTDVNCWGGDIIYVDKAAVTWTDTGTSWDNAYVDLQRALRRARRGCGCEMRVAGGIYTNRILRAQVVNFFSRRWYDFLRRLSARRGAAQPTGIPDHLKRGHRRQWYSRYGQCSNRCGQHHA